MASILKINRVCSVPLRFLLVLQFSRVVLQNNVRDTSLKFKNKATIRYAHHNQRFPTSIMQPKSSLPSLGLAYTSRELAYASVGQAWPSLGLAYPSLGLA